MGKRGNVDHVGDGGGGQGRVLKWIEKCSARMNDRCKVNVDSRRK